MSLQRPPSHLSSHELESQQLIAEPTIAASKHMWSVPKELLRLHRVNLGAYETAEGSSRTCGMLRGLRADLHPEQVDLWKALLCNILSNFDPLARLTPSQTPLDAQLTADHCTPSAPVQELKHAAFQVAVASCSMLCMGSRSRCARPQGSCHAGSAGSLVGLPRMSRKGPSEAWAGKNAMRCSSDAVTMTPLDTMTS